MNTKSKLQTFFDSKEENVQYIEKYEENKDFFNDLLLNGHKEDIEYVISIKIYKYADPLNLTGNHKKSLSILKEIENDLDKIKGQSKRYSQFLESVTFLKGVNLGRLKKYRDSNYEFEKLLIKTPTNDNYINWYKSNKKKQIGQFFDLITVIGVIYYLIIILFDFAGFKIKNLFFREFGLVSALLSFTLSYIWKGMIDKKIYKFKK